MKIYTSNIDYIPDMELEGKSLKDFLFFDIETTGLSPKTSSIYMIGTMHYSHESSCFVLTQYFAEKQGEEKNLIPAFFEKLNDYKYLVHFNGNRFDIPYICHKAKEYAICTSEHVKKILDDKSLSLSLDLYKILKPYKSLKNMEHMKQKDFERLTAYDRKDLYSGGELTKVYSSYLQSKILSPDDCDEMLNLLLLHNHDDLTGMIYIFELMNLITFLKNPEKYMIISNKDIAESIKALSGDALTISFKHNIKLPADIEADTDGLHLKLFSYGGILKTEIYKGTLKLFIPDIENYFYLPLEDTAVHKSIGEFVNKSHRKKATRSTCYIKHEGIFLPAGNYDHKYLFKEEYKSAKKYVKADDISDEYAKKWFLDIISFIMTSKKAGHNK